VTTSFVDVGMFPIDGKNKWKRRRRRDRKANE
jgi:hypothetical protein